MTLVNGSYELWFYLLAFSFLMVVAVGFAWVLEAQARKKSSSEGQVLIFLCESCKRKNSPGSTVCMHCGGRFLSKPIPATWFLDPSD